MPRSAAVNWAACAIATAAVGSADDQPIIVPVTKTLPTVATKSHALRRQLSPTGATGGGPGTRRSISTDAIRPGPGPRRANSTGDVSQGGRHAGRSGGHARID